MYYPTIGALAVLILLIENYGILAGRGSRSKQPVWKVYRRFLYTVLTYYGTDILWGFFESRKMRDALYVDTMLYFIAMAVGVYFWMRFTVTYLNLKNIYGKLLIHIGRLLFVSVTAVVAVNHFIPILFTVDEQSVYHALGTRHLILIAQILLLIVISVVAFISMSRQKDAKEKRYRTIAFFGLIMAVFLTVQIWFPYLPLYSVAYMLGTSLLHTFVITDEKEEYERELEKAYEREKTQYEELRSAWSMAYTDALTGVKSKLAFAEVEEKKDAEIKKGAAGAFAVAVFDLNGLKEINDTRGHEQGDRYIIDACKIICDHFKHSSVFRVGGDEFVALLEGNDYQKRHELIADFVMKMKNSYTTGRVSVAAGMADYTPEEDASFHDVFQRADQWMYSRKRDMKNGK